MLVSVNDFVTTVNIPNTDEAPLIADLQGFVNKYEPMYMGQLLGADLYAQLTAGLQEEPIPAKWTALKNAITTEQIAQFIYWYFVRKKNTYLSGMNIAVKPQSENAINVSPIVDQVQVWNDMVESSYKSAKFIQDNNVDYGNYYLPNVFKTFYYGRFNWVLMPDIFYKQNDKNI